MFNKIVCEILHGPSFYSSKFYSSHYEILKLPRNCSSKDIKESFIKLSKRNHPDLNKNKSAHEKFLKIKEAYNVLSKPESRKNYDLGLSFPGTGHEIRKPGPNVYYRGKNPWSDPTFYANRDTSQDKFYQERPYYGINGLDKRSNDFIAFACVILTAIVAGLQFYAIRNSATFQREDLIRKSDEAKASLMETKNQAFENGNSVQIERLKAKLALNRQI